MTTAQPSEERWRCNLDGMTFPDAEYEQHRADHHGGGPMAVSWLGYPEHRFVDTTGDPFAALRRALQGRR